MLFIDLQFSDWKYNPGNQKSDENKTEKANEDNIVEEEETVTAEDEPLVSKNVEKGDTRPQAKLSTYHNLALYSGGYHFVLFILILYGLSVGLCQATIYWIGLWMNLLRNPEDVSV